MIWIAKQWRCPKLVYSFFILEFALTIPALVLFALADPDEYRTRLWEDGFRNGFNSSPKDALYRMANYEPPNVPLIWSQFITTFNVVISVLSMFILLIKAVMFILHIWVPILSFLVHGGLAAAWAYSVYAQTSPDTSNPRHSNPGAPWYLTKSCSVSFYATNQKYCRQAKGAFAITVIMLAVFAANALFAAVCIIPTKAEREARERDRAEDADSDIDDMEAAQGGSPHSDDDNSIEMEAMRAKDRAAVSTMSMKSPAFAPGTAVGSPGFMRGHGGMAAETAMTPRTTAFNRLGGGRGDLPLRR